MKKLILIMIAVGTLLTACGNDTKEKVQSKSKPTTMKQSQHQIKKENGITTVDGFVLANKKVPLPKNFNPGENANARNHLNQMIQNAKAKGLDIVYRSGFRSYQQQVSLFNSYVQRDGRKAAEKYSSPPGYSEHQTGLAFDVGSNRYNKDFLKEYGETPEGKWLVKHAHEYGFILRYPKGKEQITGYQYEPWHFRYVGKKTAKAIYDKQLTLEEYLDYGYDKKSIK